MKKSRGVIKQFPADFMVYEQLDFPLTGEGEHLWCYVEKTGLNTVQIKREWSRLTGILQRDIAHSGLKDRHALTGQWFSLPAKQAECLPNEGDGWRILNRERNRRKLRIGSHYGNDFVITVREIDGDRTAIEQGLQLIKTRGFANYFAEQRFGQRNLAQALTWVDRGSLPKKHEERGRVLSVLRAYCFNQELAARVQAGNAFCVLTGDDAVLAGTNSYFFVETADAEIEQRCLAGDIAAAGWLPGKGDNPSSGKGAEIRTAALADSSAIVDYLCRYAESGRRALSVRAQSLTWQWQDTNTLTLSFRLPRGSYATALLAEIFVCEDASRPKYDREETIG